MWFFALIYIIVGLLRESYLEFVAAQYDCDQCRWMAESKRNGQLPADCEWWALTQDIGTAEQEK